MIVEKPQPESFIYDDGVLSFDRADGKSGGQISVHPTYCCLQCFDWLGRCPATRTSLGAPFSSSLGRRLQLANEAHAKVQARIGEGAKD
jgi:hypothetical protein